MTISNHHLVHFHQNHHFSHFSFKLQNNHTNSNFINIQSSTIINKVNSNMFNNKHTPIHEFHSNSQKSLKQLNNNNNNYEVRAINTTNSWSLSYLRFHMKKEHEFYHLKSQKVIIITKALKPTSRKSDYSLISEKETIPLTSKLQQSNS